MKFLAMHIINQKLSFDIFMVINLLNIFMEHDLYFISLWHKRKIHFDPYNVFLAIAINIPQRLETGFVVQGHMYVCVFAGLKSTSGGSSSGLHYGQWRRWWSNYTRGRRERAELLQGDQITVVVVSYCSRSLVRLTCIWPEVSWTSCICSR